MVRKIVVVIGFALLAAGGWAQAKDCPGDADKQTCCSAKNCGGKVLSNRDRHNCSVKSKGKSWHAAGGACTNL
jgi:hypothetical protein